MTGHQILSEARRALIAAGADGWCQHPGWRRIRRDGEWCEQLSAMGRLCEVSRAAEDEFYADVLPARKAALALLDALVGMPVQRWHDTPDRTYAEVVALFDRAVVAAAPAADRRRFAEG
jgi:hypothetical protein